MAAAAAMLLTACAKDNDVAQDANTGRNVNGKGKQVVKMTTIEYEDWTNYTRGFARGESYSWSENTISSGRGLRYENGTEVSGQQYNVSYVYDGDVLKELRVEYADDEYYNYSFTYTNGLLTAIYETYMYEVEGWNMTTLTYSDGKIHEITEGDGTHTSRSVLTWEGDNVIRNEEYYRYSHNGYVTESNTIYDYTYDDKKNPMRFEDPAIAFAFGGISRLSANNVTEMTISRQDYSGTHSYTYTYEDDYPVKRVEEYISINTGANANITNTTYYEYADGTGSGHVPQIFTITVESNDRSLGTVYYDGEYAAGTTAVIGATGSYQHAFRCWSDGNTDNPRSITVNANATYTAIFGNSN